MGFNGERHEHASGGDGGTELNPSVVNTGGGTLNEVYVVPPDTSDWGKAVQDIHDRSEVGTDDVIYTPPGQYDQSTAVTLTKAVHLIAEGGVLNASADIRKQADITGLIVDSNGITVSGYKFDGQAVADASTGVEIRQRSTVNVRAREHGSHGIHVNQNDSGSNINQADFRFRSDSNGGDGVRVENTSGSAININGPIIEVYDTFSNGGDGINLLNGRGLIVDVGKSNQNGGYGVNVQTARAMVRVARTENNTSGSVNLNDVDIFLSYGVLIEGLPNEPNFPGGRNMVIGLSPRSFRPPDETDTTRPNAGNVLPGSVIYNDTDENLNINGSTSGWVLPDGTST